MCLMNGSLEDYIYFDECHFGMIKQVSMGELSPIVKPYQ